MIGLGVYLYYLKMWKEADPPIDPVATWFPVACIFIFTITSTLGFLVVPWVMIGELYPQKVRGIVGGMTTCMAHIFVFLVVKTYPLLKDVLYNHGVFMMYGCISFLGEYSSCRCVRGHQLSTSPSRGEVRPEWQSVIFWSRKKRWRT